MPRIISADSEWKSVAFPGDIVSDRNFLFLSSFEEMNFGGSEKFVESNDSNQKQAFRSLNQKGRDILDDSRKTATGNFIKSPKKKKRKQSDGFSPKKKKRKLINKQPDGFQPNNSFNEAINIQLPSFPYKKHNLISWDHLFLPQEIMKGLIDLEFKRPTEIQNAVISCAIKERCDLLGAAETGSGKTFAFAIPLITRLLEEGISKKVDKPLLGGLILAPTRELVMQIKRQIDALLKFTKFKIITIVGGLSQQKQERLLSYCPEIIVATPGRFWAFLQTAPSGNHLEDFSGLKCFVIDEMDRMVEKGHFEELALIVDYIKQKKDEKMQTLVFSATLTFVHPPPKRLISQSKHMTTDEKIQQLAAFAALRKNYKTIDLTRSFGTAERLVEAKINCANLLEKDTAVLYLLKRYIGRTLLFINSIDAARRLHGILKKFGIKPEPLMLHAKMIQKQRLKNLEKFAATENSVLLATDVAARGLDVQNVEHVIHYQIPKTAELYIHRSGRTARASHRGLTILLVDLLDVQFYRRICQNLNREKDLSIFPIDSQNLYSALKERVGVATDLESVEYRIKKILSKESWFQKAAHEADLLLDARIKSSSYDELETLRNRKIKLESQLKNLLNMPLPDSNKDGLKKSLYVTPEMISQYDSIKSRQALHSIEEGSHQNTKKFLKIGRLRFHRKDDRKCRVKLKRK